MLLQAILRIMAIRLTFGFSKNRSSSLQNIHVQDPKLKENEFYEQISFNLPCAIHFRSRGSKFRSSSNIVKLCSKNPNSSNILKLWVFRFKLYSEAVGLWTHFIMQLTHISLENQIFGSDMLRYVTSDT